MLQGNNNIDKRLSDTHAGYRRKNKGRIASFLVTFCSLTSCLQADSSDNHDFPFVPLAMIHDIIYGEIRYFVWEEYYNGDKLVTESGFIPAIGIRGLFSKFDNRIAITYNTVLFYGIVDYDGYLQTEDMLIPYTSDTAYLGFEGSCCAVVTMEFSDFTILPFAGIKYSFWLRELGVSSSSFTRDPYGYDEYWQILHGIMGLQYKVQGSKKVPVIVTLSASVLFPLFIDETVDLTNVNAPSGIKLEPGGNPSFEMGMELDVPFRNISSRMIFGIFYRTIKFSESELDKTYQAFFQPESHYRTVGLQIGFNF